MNAPHLDEASRPTGPSVAGSVSELSRRVGDHLAEVHELYRGELAQVQDVLAQLRAGSASPGEARGELQRVALLANNWAFGGVCQRYCFALTQHHDMESGQIFPHLRRAEPELAPVLDRLHDEHLVIHHALGDVDAALVRLAAAPDDLAPIEAAIELLTATILSHFAYEERELSGPLGRHGFFPGQV